MITENLFFALQRLQDTIDTLILWVDSLCINQSNNDEKSKQVELMGSIYQQAACVIAWLGPAVDESDLAMRALDNIGYQCLSAGSKMGPIGSDERRRKNHDMHLKLLSISTIYNDPKATFPLHPVIALFRRPYWQLI
ncbi:HET-domain-containing protein [Glonium stellatum]|uniref:HET-domain-containing protein n=1 Tax=Glonium stellatum TaxID=574774 RepID=A0A8E2EP91_9PEZI|nr:HET-domain-containing protein [Glonium stellatum]